MRHCDCVNVKSHEQFCSESDDIAPSSPVDRTPGAPKVKDEIVIEQSASGACATP